MSSQSEHDTASDRAVVLLSGGLDSATALAVASHAGSRCHCLSFRYGQRHRAELDAAKRVAESLGAVDHLVLDLPLDRIGGSALTDHAIPVPQDIEQPPDRPGIPVTYVPARNTIFLSFALAHAETLGAAAIYLGVNAIDYSGYPDCRPEYLEVFRRLAELATRAGVEGRGPRIEAPLLHMTKADIVRMGTELGVDYSLTVSCYDPDEQGRACGACDSCRLRKRGFEQAGLPDPTVYRQPVGGKP